GILPGDGARQQMRSRRGRVSFDIEQVFRDPGDAVKRAEVASAVQVRLRGASLRECALAEDEAEGAEPGIEGGDALEKELRERDRAQLAGSKPARERGDGLEMGRRQGQVLESSVRRGAAKRRGGAAGVLIRRALEGRHGYQ